MQIDAKSLSTIHKYINRMMFRSTPNGLFSNYSLASVGECTNLIIRNTNYATVFNQFNGESLNIIYRIIIKFLFRKNSLRILANETINKDQAQIRFHAPLKFLSDRFGLKMMSSNEYVEKIIRFLDNSQSIDEVATLLSSLGHSDPLNYVKKLVKIGLLVPELAVPTYLERPLSHIKDYIDQNHSHEKDLTNSISNLVTIESITLPDSCSAIRSHLGELDSALVNAKECLQITDNIKGLSTTDSMRALLHVDVKVSGDAYTISESLTKTVAQTTHKLLSLTFRPSDAHRAIAREIYRKHGSEPISILKLLDTERGINLTGIFEDPTKHQIDNKFEQNFNSFVFGCFATTDDTALRADGINIATMNYRDNCYSAINGFVKAGATLFSVTKDRHSSKNNVWIKSIIGPTGNELISRLGVHDKEVLLFMQEQY